MGLVNGALQIGQGALLSYQSALQVVGNNIANAGVDGYTRQTPLLTSRTGVPLPEGLLAGGGVALSALQRNLSEAVESQLRAAMGDEQKTQTQQEALSQIESLYNELGDRNLSGLLNAFFGAFQSVATKPTDGPTRDMAIQAGQSLAAHLQQTRSGLADLFDQLNRRISDAVGQVNDLARSVADLNRRIVQAEAAGTGAAASLRDQRDGTLKQLAQLIDIRTSETSTGAVNVFVGNLPLVQLTESNSLATTRTAGDYGVALNVCFADNSMPLPILGGQIAGLLTVRDGDVVGQMQQVDSLAADLIRQVNRLHAGGQGLQGLTTLTGAYAVNDPSAPLSAAGLPFAPANGSFVLTVTQDGNGPSQQAVIPVSAAGSLQDLVNAINARATNLTAAVTADHRLTLQAAAGYSFTFGEDDGGALAGLGMNVFFSGRSAADIAVESTLAADPQRLAAATTGAPGDGGNAAAIAALATQALSGNGPSLPRQWQAVVAALAGRSSDIRQAGEAAHSVAQSLQAQRESVSGVNTDEEAVSLMRYQRSFQAAARYITIVDQLVSEMLSMVRS